MVDLLIKNGLVIDGTGRPGFISDVVVEGDEICGLAQSRGMGETRSRRVIDADGMVVCPGFIDIHSHSEVALLREPTAPEKTLQGVTTELVGNCGFSLGPACHGSRRLVQEYLATVFGGLVDESCVFASLDEYFNRLERQGTAVNVASYVGQGTVRAAVLGFSERSPSSAEMGEMQLLVRQAMEQGAVGLSAGLVYPPGSYATTDELVELCRLVAEYRGIYASHLRDEGDRLVEAVTEALQIGRKAGIGVQISHLKASGERNWSKMDSVLRLIDDAVSSGEDVAFDQYPYEAGSTGLTRLLPPWVLEGGIEKAISRLSDADTRAAIKELLESGTTTPGWDNLVASVGWGNIVVSSVGVEENRWCEGKSLAQIAQTRNAAPADAYLDLLVSENGGGVMVVFQQSEANVRKAMVHPRQMFGTDGLHSVTGKPHPRLYGTYPRIMGHYVRGGVLDLPTAIHKASLAPARRIGLTDRGRIAPGMKADIVVMNPEAVRDLATYADPRQYPQGIEYVIVNGEVVTEKGQVTGLTPGRVLRRKGSRPVGQA